MNKLTKKWSLVAVAAVATMMFVSPTLASTNSNAVNHAPSNVLAHQMTASQTLGGHTQAISPNSSPSVPTSFWDLSGGTYTDSFSSVSTTGVYSDYYFTPNNGSLYLKAVSAFSDTGTRITCVISLYDKTTGLWVSSQNLTTNSGGTSFSFTNLNPSDQYYFGARSGVSNNTVTGHYTVSWTP
ncbi:MAG: hypothetical protein ACXVDJ_04785 [Tumebacillaceae bacterium]